ncbi:hypothetical protein MIMGU_mgv1a0207361mg, partial [Erythranthe guttata]
MNNSR